MILSDFNTPSTEVYMYVSKGLIFTQSQHCFQHQAICITLKFMSYPDANFVVNGDQVGTLRTIFSLPVTLLIKIRGTIWRYKAAIGNNAHIKSGKMSLNAYWQIKDLHVHQQVEKSLTFFPSSKIINAGCVAKVWGREPAYKTPRSWQPTSSSQHHGGLISMNIHDVLVQIFMIIATRNYSIPDGVMWCVS